MSVIQIPSKNIFSIDNPKVLDNQIDKIEVGAKEPSIVTEIANIYNTSISATDFNTRNPQENGNAECTIVPYYDTAGQFHAGLNGDWAYLNVEPYYKNVTIRIPAQQENSVILDILTGLDKNDNANIQYTIYGDKITAQQNGSLYLIALNTSSGYYQIDNYGFRFGSVTGKAVAENEILDLSAYKEPISYTYNPTPQGSIVKPVTVEVSISDIGNIETQEFDKTNNVYIATFTIFCGLRMRNIGGQAYLAEGRVITGYSPHTTYEYEIPCSGTYEEYLPKEIRMSFEGKSMSLRLSDKTIKIGDGNGIIYFDGNELMQNTLEITHISKRINGTTGEFVLDGFYPVSGDVFVGLGEEMRNLAITKTATGINNRVEYNKSTGYVSWTVYGTSPNTPIIAVITGDLVVGNPLADRYAKIIDQYKDGKEIATIRCSIDDYYDENGQKVIDIKNGKMLFHQYDKVIPYVYGANGEDRPMSQYKDGKPKVFEVLSTRPFGDGAVWQELVLVESKQ